MKHTIKLFQILILSLFFWSCKKDEHKEYFEGGNAPVLAASTTNVALTSADKAKEAVRFSWTNPNYLFTTGVSSQNVSYTVQLDTVGAAFSSSVKQEFNVTNDLTYGITVGDLNKYLIKMKLEADVPHNIEARVASNLNGTVPLYSNAIQFAGLTPYEDFAVPPPPTGELFITGDATPSSWTNEPPASQQVTKDNKGLYHIEMDFVPGKAYKFLSNLKQWQPQYGGKSATGGDINVNLGNGSDPDAIPTPAEAGKYRITLDFRTGKYTVVKV